MQINIKKLDGQKEEFSLEPSDSVMKVKEMLAEKTGVHKDQIRLIFKGKPMLDDKVTPLLTERHHTTPHHNQSTRTATAHRVTMTASYSPPFVLCPSLVLSLAACLVQTLDEQDVKAGNTVHMIMQMRGGQ